MLSLLAGALEQPGSSGGHSLSASASPSNGKRSEMHGQDPMDAADAVAGGNAGEQECQATPAYPGVLVFWCAHAIYGCDADSTALLAITACALCAFQCNSRCIQLHAGGLHHLDSSMLCGSVLHVAHTMCSAPTLAL